MTAKDRLQVILITYNRADFVKEALGQFFYDGSPVKDYDFLVLDNNSTDNTFEVVNDFQKSYTNIRYQKNKYNLGIAGNIARAMEIADKDYVWIIGDDDKFDFSNWGEVETAIENNEEIICVSRHCIPDISKAKYPNILIELTFITGGIYKTSLYNDTTIKNAYDNIYTIFPHIAPVISFINENKKVYIVEKPISFNGYVTRKIDNSYIRGCKKPDEIYTRIKTLSWAVGYANICSNIHDKHLREEVFMYGMRCVMGYKRSLKELFEIFSGWYAYEETMMQYIDLYMASSSEFKKMLKKFILKHYFNVGFCSIYKVNQILYIKLLNGMLVCQFNKEIFKNKIRRIKAIFYLTK